MAATDELFPEVKPGDPIKADAWNDISRQVAALSNLGDDMHVLAVGGMILRRGNKRGKGSSAATVTFEITSIVRGFGLNCHCVEATVINISCGAGDVEIGDTINVWDGLFCQFLLPEMLLIGLKGIATRMNNLNDLLVQDGFHETGDCRWEAVRLCCAEEVIDSL